MKKYFADVFVTGDDRERKFDFLRKEGGVVLCLPRAPDVSNSQIKWVLGEQSPVEQG